MDAAPKRPTIRDVATAANVSSGTVSRVLNGRNWVSPEARTAVEAAIKKTGYRVNPHARNLAMSRSNTIAFLLVESQQVLFEDPNFARLVRGTSEALAARDMYSVLIMAGDQAERERALSYITAGHVDGVLLGFSTSGGEDLIEALLAAHVPIVACGQPAGFEGRLGSVSADDRIGAVAMVRHLVDSGRTRIATVTGPLDMNGGISRLDGYRRVLGDAVDERLVVNGDYTRAGGAAGARELLARGVPFDAVFAANDAMAAGVIDVLTEAGMRVPDDVAVAGFDDNVIAQSTTPPLSTVHQPFERISAEMVRLLTEIIAGESPASITLPTTIVLRESA
ncbi:LacI family transcriptional regulator [Herbiconiux moechotypicola]|uniref:LacI family DNA-binding transcriptional regulator n=1 Tax=Herbiconiux moechotypicola TaxID=637393 RepID=A0ABP5Q5A1_9MICO|nr:LacI family DNA-binding transcriptional regulator [Herbiconiux moechotypicola]MCS5728207.1 LacI family transcriptional regulator [Herbiconiux moechotypicola]